MKAISLWQPWASLWFTDSKIHETRHWSTRHRGPLYVHAAKRPIRESDLSDRLIEI
jgi:activating signal cointegrator 1